MAPIIPASGFILLGLGANLVRSPMAVFLLLTGLVAFLFSATMLVRAIPQRARPRPEPPAEPKKPQRVAPQPTAPVAPAPTKPAPKRPRSTSDHVRILFPGISDDHPDVWGLDQSFDVQVRIQNDNDPVAGARIRLFRSVKGRTDPIGEATTDDKGDVRFQATFTSKGEEDLVATIIEEGRSAGQAVRAIRIVDYREEIVETFDDFKSWAAQNFDFVNPKQTAREFVDLLADGRPGTPTAPLDTIVAIYEIANYSEHPVDRQTYTRLVDAFLELENAGALDAEPQEA